VYGQITRVEKNYIRIDPIADKTIGDLLVITGSTNYPAGTILFVMTSKAGGDAMVRNGTGGVNRFFVPIDTYRMKPGPQKILVTQMTGDPLMPDFSSGAVQGTANFTLKGTYLGVDTPVKPTVTADDYIRISPISGHSSADPFLITGATSLPAGTPVLWQIFPATGTIQTVINESTTGYMADSMVTKGDGPVNRVSLAVDTGNLKPGAYIAAVSITEGDLSTGNMKLGSLTGTASFTLK
jgi:hypothetical protein